jgi:HD superfamily phosphohydrolase
VGPRSAFEKKTGISLIKLKKGKSNNNNFKPQMTEFEENAAGFRGTERLPPPNYVMSNVLSSTIASVNQRSNNDSFQNFEQNRNLAYESDLDSNRKFGSQQQYGQNNTPPSSNIYYLSTNSVPNRMSSGSQLAHFNSNNNNDINNDSTNLYDKDNETFVYNVSDFNNNPRYQQQQQQQQNLYQNSIRTDQNDLNNHQQQSYLNDRINDLNDSTQYSSTGSFHINNNNTRQTPQQIVNYNPGSNSQHFVNSDVGTFLKYDSDV